MAAPPGAHGSKASIRENDLKYSSINRGIPGGNPLANALVVVVGFLAIAAFVVLGFFAFVVLGSVFLVLGAIIGLRVWWFNRKLQRTRGTAQGPSAKTSGGVIEGEFEVLEAARDEGAKRDS